MRPMQTERLEEMRLTATDDAQISTLLQAAFGPGFNGRSYFQQRHHVRLVIRQDDRIVGHMALCLRAIRMGETLAQIAGLADVATDPAWQGQGIASKLMAAAIAEAGSSPADFFVLFGDRPLYAASGFLPKTNSVRFTDCSDVRTGDVMQTASEGLMVLPLGQMDWDDAAVIDLVGHAF